MLTECIAVSTDLHVFASVESSRTFRAFPYFFICHVQMILPIVFICLASVDDLCALSVVANKNFSQLRRIAAGAFFQSLEPGDQQLLWRR